MSKTPSACLPQRPSHETDAAAALVVLGSSYPCDVKRAFYESPSKYHSENVSASDTSSAVNLYIREYPGDSGVSYFTPETRQHTERCTGQRDSRDTRSNSRLCFASGPGLSRSNTASEQPRTTIPGWQPPSEELYPISLRVSAGINVSQHHNVVALTCTPAELANSITSAIVTALNSGGIARNGIPMTGPNGRPRPVIIEVNAGITIEGTNNIIGTEDCIKDIVQTRHAAP